MRPARGHRQTERMAVNVLVPVLVLGAVMGVSSSPSTKAPPPLTLDEASRRLDTILNNTRSRENYIRCFMDRGICNKDALSIKKILTEALTANCSNCTQAQRVGADRFFEYLRSNQREAWDKLTDKYGGDDDEDDSEDSDDDDDDKDDKGDKGGQHNHTTPTHTPTTTHGSNASTTTISIIF